MTGQYSSGVEDVIALDDTQTLRQRDKFRPLARRWHTNIWKNTALVSPTPRKHKHDKSRHRWEKKLASQEVGSMLKAEADKSSTAVCMSYIYVLKYKWIRVFFQDSKKTFTWHIYILCSFTAFSRFNSVRFLRTTSYYHVINNSHLWNKQMRRWMLYLIFYCECFLCPFASLTLQFPHAINPNQMSEWKRLWLKIVKDSSRGCSKIVPDQ